MQEEMEAESENRERIFKNEMFGHAFLTQNPELFQKIFPTEIDGLTEEEEEQIEWLVPESPMEAMQMLEEIKMSMNQE
jgi:tellurite resistance protein